VARKEDRPVPPAAGEEGFDQRLERLEGLVAELELGDLGLEAALAKYQQGIELLRQCHTQLATYQKQVQELASEAEGVLRPYAGDPDAKESR
jgi:exodeoxyribonuclease VII small subunit